MTGVSTGSGRAAGEHTIGGVLVLEVVVCWCGDTVHTRQVVCAGWWSVATGTPNHLGENGMPISEASCHGVQSEKKNRKKAQVKSPVWSKMHWGDNHCSCCAQVWSWLRGNDAMLPAAELQLTCWLSLLCHAWTFHGV